MRAYVRDIDAGIGYFDNEYFAGVVAPNENGVLHIERRYGYAGIEEVYRVDTRNPGNSVAYAWHDGETPAEIPKTQALGNVIHMLGTFAHSYTTSDYTNAHPASREPHQFAHHDLQDNQPQAEQAAS